MGTPTTIPAGLATWLGIATSVILYAAAIVQAINGGDAEALGTAAGGLLATLTTLGGRYAQAVAQIRTGAGALAAAIDDPDLAELAAEIPSGTVQES